MELDLFTVIPNSPSLLGVAATRIGENFMLSGGFEHFPSAIPSTNVSPFQNIAQQNQHPLDSRSVGLSAFSNSIDNSTLPLPTSSQKTQSSMKKLPLSQQKASTYLQVRVLHVPTATWSPSVIVSNGLFNRAYHASATIRDEVFLFGGVSKVGNGTALEACLDVIRVRKGTFGYKSNVLSLEEHQHVAKSASTVGLSATTCGKEQDCVVLFGGYQHAVNGSAIGGVYTNSVYLFRAVEEKLEVGPSDGSQSPRPNHLSKKVKYMMKQVDVDTNGATPPPRAYHTATLVTPNPSNPNQAFLVIFGGETEGKHMLNDMWILDLTEVLNAEYHVPEVAPPVVETKPAKGGKASKNDPVVPLKTNVATWMKVTYSSSSSVVVLPRCKHNAFHVRSPNVFYHPHGHPPEDQHLDQSSQSQKHYEFTIFGGLSTKGTLSLIEYNTFSLVFDSTTNKLAATLTGGSGSNSGDTSPHALGEGSATEEEKNHHKLHLKSFHPSVNMKNMSPPLLKALLSSAESHGESIYGSAIGLVYDQDFVSQREDQLMDEHERILVGLLVFGGCKTMTVGGALTVTGTMSGGHQSGSSNHSQVTYGNKNYGKNSVANRALSVLPEGFLASFDATFMITTASRDPSRAGFVDEPITIYKRIRRIVLKAHQHIDGMRILDEEEQNKLNHLKQKTIRYGNGDVYFGEVMKFKPRPESEDEINVSGVDATDSFIGGADETKASSVSRPRTRESWYDGRHKGPYHHMDVDDNNSVGTLDMENPEGIPGIHVPHGQGKMNYANGDVYEGTWHEGERHGSGTLSIYDEKNPKLPSIYEGDFVYDQRTGKGKFTTYSPLAIGNSIGKAGTSSSGNGTNNGDDTFIKTVYEGSFLNGLYHGYGELTLQDNSDTLIYHRIFKGQFVHHRKHGPGSIHTIHHKLERHESSKLPKDEPSIVEGEWKDDKMIGFGKASNFLIQSLNISLGHIPGENKSSFQMVEHHFSKNIVKMTSVREEKLWLFGAYTGTLVPSLDNSISLLSPTALIPYAESSRCIYEDGSIYEGSWKTGRRNGHGNYYFPDGSKYEGKWIGDKRCGFGRLLALLSADLSALQYGEGDIDGERRTGILSILSSPDEQGRQYVTIYEGQWEENTQHGEGVLYNREQRNYFLGQFVYGMKQGNGRYHDLETNKVLEETTFAHDHVVPVSKILGQTTAF